VRQASAVGEETQRALAQQMQGHVSALASLSAAGASFNELAEQVKREVRALPNPADRLTGLWDDVRSLEITLATSIGGASEQLALLSRRSEELSTALSKLEHSTGVAATNVENGGKQLGETLRRELTQMNAVLDQYTRLFEQNVGIGTVQ
jgi:ABC-type transporter Mla subunit MlaD